jgi:hypothetical protein
MLEQVPHFIRFGLFHRHRLRWLFPQHREPKPEPDRLKVAQVFYGAHPRPAGGKSWSCRDSRYATSLAMNR